MASVPLALPLKASEAAALADLLFQHAGSRPLTGELRARFGGRAAALRFSTMEVFPGSLERDPIHPSAFYVAADALEGGRRAPLMLRLAPASSPSSGLFPDSLLVGRMRTNRRAEIVVNAIPFAPSDHQNIRTFAEQVNRAFLPRPQGLHPTLAVGGGQPEISFPAAFDAFRSILKSCGQNLAAVAQLSAAADRAYHASLWAAIRAGWREGFSAVGGPFIVSSDMPEEIAGAATAIRQAAAFTRFSIDTSRLTGARTQGTGMEGRFLRSLEIAEQLFDTVREAGRAFDFELSLEEASEPTSAEELGFCLRWLKERGRAARLVAPNFGLDGPPAEVAVRARELAAVARQFAATLSVRVESGVRPEVLEAIGRATAGRVNLTVQVDPAAGRAEASAGILSLAERLRG